MSKQEVMKLQTCVLRVNIHCDGCKKKVKKLLQKIEGVYTVAIDAEQGKVTVTGIVDPSRLINKLEKSGKHAELWGPSKNFSNQNVGFNNQLFKNIQFENGKFGKSENKSHNDGGNKGGHQHQQQQQQQQQLMKALKDMKMGPSKEQKTVKFKIPVENEFNASGDDFEDEFGDDDDDLSGDEFADELGHGHHQKPSKPSISSGQHGQKGSRGKENGQKKGGSGGKKGSLFDNIPFLMKGLGMKGDAKKHGTGGKSGSGGGGGGGKSKGGGEKGGGKTGGFFGDFEKNGDFDEVAMKNKGGNGNGKGGVGGNNNNSGGKKGGGKNHDGSQANHKAQANFKGMNNQHASNHQRLAGMVEGDEGGFMSQMGSMGAPVGNYPASQMVGMPAVQGLPAMNGGYYQNPYQQQYMAMMMNQHPQHQGFGNGMYQPMMYARQPQPVGYVPPMPPPPSDPYVHMFSDENTGSCSVM